jgi:hypothetical protein
MKSPDFVATLFFNKKIRNLSYKVGAFFVMGAKSGDFAQLGFFQLSLATKSGDFAELV